MACGWRGLMPDAKGVLVASINAPYVCVYRITSCVSTREYPLRRTTHGAPVVAQVAIPMPRPRVVGSPAGGCVSSRDGC
jgi:hypothetical protein